MKIGVAFDKVLIHDDPILHQLACARELIPASTPVHRPAIQAALLEQGLESDWIDLQTEVSGEYILLAKPYAGALDFFAMAQEQSITLYIVSEKPRYALSSSDCDLHHAVHKWLTHYGFAEQTESTDSIDSVDSLSERVFLELSETDKLQRIAQLGCDFFIDPDPGFLSTPGFPLSVRRILFDPTEKLSEAGSSEFKTVAAWAHLQKMLLRT